MESDDDFFSHDDLRYDEVEDDEVDSCVYKFMCEDDDLGKPAAAAEKSHYTVLNEERIRQLQDEDISHVCSRHSVSRGVACILLLRNNWSPCSVEDELYGEIDDNNVELLQERESLIRLIQKPDINDYHHNNYCKICLEKVDQDKNMLPGPCGHHFCTDCWKSYIAISISQDGPACLQLRCPEPECKVNVGPEMIELLATGEDKEKYYRYLSRSYVEGRGDIRWCPGPGCDLAIRLNNYDNYCDVTCDCSYGFCWACMEERHRPVRCPNVENWMKKSSGGSEEFDKNNNTWIRAFTKPCPNCRRNIEKNHGSIHMTCPIPCGHQFCWLCLGPLINNDNHGAGVCNKTSMVYAHFHNIWVRQHKLREDALANIRRANKGLIRKLANVQKVPECELQFVIGALEQIVECRRVLKWSCVYAHDLRYTARSLIKQRYLSHLQRQGEAAVITLERCAYKGLKKYTNTNVAGEGFMDFRAKLVYLTNGIKKYFEKFVVAIERGLIYEANYAHILSSSSEPSVVRQPPQQPLIYGPWRQQYHAAIHWSMDHSEMIFFFGFLFLVLFLSSIRNIFLLLLGYIAFPDIF